VYTWVGFLSVDVVPSPKSQYHDFGLPDDLSMNFTDRGIAPCVGLAVKSAALEGFEMKLIFFATFRPLTTSWL
jgi:hypothetical protein